MAKNENGQKAKKPLYKKWWFWVIVVSLVGAAGSGLSGSDEPAEPSASQTETTPPSESQEPETTPDVDPADSETAPEPTQTDLASEPVTPSDWEIIARDGHPTLYGSLEAAHAIWDDAPKGKVLFPDGYDRWSDTTILSMDAYRDSDLIREVYVSFTNAEIPASVTINDIIPLVVSYMPFDVMDEYYEFNYSCAYEPDDGKEVTDKYYVVSYALTDEAKEDYYKNKHEYSGTIDVIICVLENEQVKNFDIRFGTPRWMSSLKTNRMHKVPWECNLYDYSGS